MVDVKCLSDCELQDELRKLGFSPGPILPSTRKVYENKLVQLLVLAPSAAPVVNGFGEPDEPQESDACQEFNTTIVLKGNIKVSAEKGKGPKKDTAAMACRPTCHQCMAGAVLCPVRCTTPLRTLRPFLEITKPLLRASFFKKRPEAATTKCKVPDRCSMDCKASKIRCAARSSKTRIRQKSTTKKKDCSKSQKLKGLPVAILFAVFAVFIIVVFTYITVERKPLFGYMR